MVFIVGLIVAAFAPLLPYDFIQTGYQDWMYHAFRIKSLSTYDFLSWDSIWSNGINHWQSYQYIPHLLTLGMLMVTSLSLTKAMTVTLLVISAVSAVIFYFALRNLSIRPIAAWLAVLLCFTSPELWRTTKDFSIFFFLPFLAIMLWVWAKGVERKKSYFALGALSGISWVIHPMLGIISGGLWAIGMFISYKNSSKLELFFQLVVFGLSSLLFTLPYFLSSPSFMSPHLTTTEFVLLTMKGAYWGLGMLLTWCVVFSWFFLTIQAKHSPLWAKALLAYVTFILLLVGLMRMSMAPHFVYFLQLSRSIPLLAMCIAFAVAPTIQYLTRFTSRYFRAVVVGCVAILSLLIVDISSSNLPRGVSTVADPVTQYFQKFPELPAGSIWTEDVSKASLMAPLTLRYATSYNQHREPHPYASRINGLMQNDLAFTGITNKQISLLNSYSRVLGIEYIFLPKLSPLASSLTEASNSANTFRMAENQLTTTSDYAALQNSTPIHYAYRFPRSEELLKKSPSFPTMASQSWEPWDSQIIWLDEQLKNESVKPVELTFPAPDRLQIELSESLKGDEGLLVAQSYDKDWKSNVAGLEILPTVQRFMFLKPPAGWSGTIELKHSWPRWHMPVQILSFVVAFVTIMTEAVYLTFVRRAPEQSQVS